MANPEHVKILRQGDVAWNAWRLKNPSVTPDFSNANLYGLTLTSTLGTGITNIIGANLRGADFSGAKLFEARINGADLIETNLRGASLVGALLSGGSLSKADLSNANLVGVFLNQVNLRDVNFSGSEMGFTKLIGLNLSQTIGLDSVQHIAPSNIDIDTFYNSSGKIPKAFLQGCGVPDEFITYMRSLVAHPIQFYSCFISYSSKDQDFANRLYADLQNKGVRCWFAPEDLKIGDRIRDRIDESIRLRDKLLLILTESSISSDWVEHEVEGALEEERQRGRTILFPIRLDDAAMDSSKAWAALIRRTRHIGDFTRWKDHDSYQKAFDRLLRDLKAEEGKP
jgi:hypothetical protein